MGRYSKMFADPIKLQHKDSIISERNRGVYFNEIELDTTKVINMSASVEKESFPDIILKRDNYEEWNQFIRRKLNEVPMMVDWIQGNQEAEQDFSVIPFQTRVVRLRQVPEPGTGMLVDQEVEEWHTHPPIWAKDQLSLRRSTKESVI